MSDAYIGEIRMFAGAHEPYGWRHCDGRLMAIDEYPALFAAIGNSFGGDGITHFALPDLCGRVPIGMGGPNQPHPFGDKGGQEKVKVTKDHLPAHHHDVLAATRPGDSASPAHATLAATDPGARERLYAQSPRIAAMPLAPDSVGPSQGGEAALDNMMPSIVINYIIAVIGSYPFYD